MCNNRNQRRCVDAAKFVAAAAATQSIMIDGLQIRLPTLIYIGAPADSRCLWPKVPVKGTREHAKRLISQVIVLAQGMGNWRRIRPIAAKTVRALSTSGINTRINGVWQLVWLALLVVAWTQVAIAGHQFEHSGTAAADTCEICVQLDRSDGALLPDAAPASPSATQHPTTVPATKYRPIAAAAGYWSRAPPTLHIS